MADAPQVLRYSAFAATPDGGNPAGVVLEASGLDDADMQRIAAEVGYSETAFVVGRSEADGEQRFRVRYWSPAAEVPFCGHATVATAIALAERDGAGAVVFDTNTGAVALRSSADAAGGTVTVLHAKSPSQYEARNLFPVGRITEDPATGSAAASTGAYLRERGLAGQTIRIRQGAHVGRPSELVVDIPKTGGIEVSGGATRIV